MRRRNSFGWLLAALLPHGAMAAEQPTTSLLQSVLPSTLSAEGVDTVISAMKEIVWGISSVSDGVRSRSGVMDDMGRFVLTDETLKEIESIRDRIVQAKDPATGMISLADLAPLERVMTREMCKVTGVMMHWSDGSPSAVQADLDKPLALLPPARREAFEKEIQAIAAATRTDREQLERDIRECHSVQSGDVPGPARRSNAATSGLAEVRLRIAAAMREARDAREIIPPWQQRTSTCPAPNAPTPGQSRPAVRKAANVARHYPALARNTGIVGSVRVRLEINPEGCVVAAGIFETSGSGVLDDAAIRIAWDYEFIPAEVDGKPARSFMILPMNFSLREP